MSGQVHEVNATAVIERPTAAAQSSGLFSLLAAAAAKTKPPQHPVHKASGTDPIITIKDFGGYISLLKKARREAGLPEDEDIDASESAAGATSDSTGLTSSRWRGHGIATFAPSGDAFDIVPPYFFRREFRLSDPAIMKEVFQPGKNLDELQDGLTVLLDTVECQLLGSIKARSRQFFEALSSLQELRDRVLDGNIAATALRRQLERVRDESCLQPLSVIILHRRRNRASAAMDLMQHMHRAAAAPAAAAALYNSGDWMGALDAIRQAIDLIHGKLTGVYAVQGIKRRLEDFGRMITGEISERFSGECIAIAVSGDTSVPLAGIEAADGSSGSSSTAVGPSAASAGTPAVVALETALQTRVRPLVDGLTRTRRLGQAMDKLQASLVNEVKEFIRTDVDEAVYAELWASGAVDGAAAGAGQAATVVTAEKIQGLSAQSFLKVFTSVTARVLELISRLQGLHDFLERTLDAQGRSGAHASSHAQGGADAGSAAAVAAATADWEAAVSAWRAQSSALVAVGVDSASRHLARLLGLRRDVSARLKLAELRLLWEAASGYTNAAHLLLTQSLLGSGSAIGGALGTSAGSRTGMGPAGLLQASATSLVQAECMEHARTWIAHVRERNVASLAQLLDSEAWKQADVPSQVQAVATAIEASVTTGPAARGAAAVAAAVAAAGSSGSAAGAHDVHVSRPGAPESSDCMVIGGQRFPVVASGVMLVKMLGDYSGAAEALPDLAAEAIAATAELLREFNSRATSLVLGAGAIATAALKKITAKHLALTLQTLGALLALLPSVRALLLMRLPAHQHTLLSDLASVTADILSHENRLRAKFVAIVKDLLVKCCSDMRGLPWGRPGVSFTSPSGPMSELVKGVTTLHRILCGVLRSEQLEDITSRILVMINSYLPGQVQAIMSHVSLAQASAGADGAGGAGAFSRELMLSRLGADVGSLLTQLDGLLPDPRLDTPRHGLEGAGQASAAISAPGRDALVALARWATSTFGSAAVQLPGRLAEGIGLGPVASAQGGASATPTAGTTAPVATLTEGGETPLMPLDTDRSQSSNGFAGQGASADLPPDRQEAAVAHEAGQAGPDASDHPLSAVNASLTEQAVDVESEDDGGHEEGGHGSSALDESGANVGTVAAEAGSGTVTRSGQRDGSVMEGVPEESMAAEASTEKSEQ